MISEEELEPGMIAFADQVWAGASVSIKDMFGHYCEFRARTASDENQHPLLLDEAASGYLESLTVHEATTMLVAAMVALYEHTSPQEKETYIREHKKRIGAHADGFHGHGDDGAVQIP